MLKHAIADYHTLLDAEAARTTHATLTMEQRAHNLFFGDRPLVTVLRPRFLSREQYDLIRTACGRVADAAHRLAKALLDDPTLRSGLALTPGEEALIAMHPGYPEPSAHSRMDTFLTLDGGLRFVEYNAESPAAIAYGDVLSDVFLDLPIMRRFTQSYTVTTLPARQHLFETLLAAWQSFGGTRTPTIAIVDWKGVPTHSEFLLFQRYFRGHGIDALVCSPDDLHYRDGRLYARPEHPSAGANIPDIPVDLIYKRVLTSEFLTHYGAAALDHPLVRAYADGKVCLVNSFRAKLLHKKSIFALLTDDALQSGFTSAERAAISAHVPWTRMVQPGDVTYQGETHNLLAFARAHQQHLLLKPNDEYGGKGIVIGWETSPAEWEGALADALQSPYVLQERVEIAYEDYPAFVDGQLVIGRRLVDSDPFLFGTAVHGCLTRLSTVTLLNVTAGGGSTIPTFVIEPRSRPA